MVMMKTGPEQALDQEWVILLKAARELGLKKEDISAFLSRKDSTIMKLPKRGAIG